MTRLPPCAQGPSPCPLILSPTWFIPHGDSTAALTLIRHPAPSCFHPSWDDGGSREQTSLNPDPLGAKPYYLSRGHFRCFFKSSPLWFLAETTLVGTLASGLEAFRLSHHNIWVGWGPRVHTEQVCWHAGLLSDWEIILSSTASSGFRRGKNPMCSS